MRIHVGKGVGFLAGWALTVGGCSPWTAGRSTGPLAKGLPSSWSADKAPSLGVDQAWIARFKDPQLIRLVEEAMNKNPDLKATAERVRRAEAVARLAGAGKRPQVSGQINTLQQKQRFPGFPIKLGSNTAESYGASLDVTWEPDLWGRVRDSQRAAVMERRGSKLCSRKLRSTYG